MHARTSGKGERQAFYDRIAGRHLAPLWEVLDALVPPAPRSPCVPVHWSYAHVRPFLLEPGALFSFSDRPAPDALGLLRTERSSTGAT